MAKQPRVPNVNFLSDFPDTLNVTRSLKPLIGCSEVLPAKGPVTGRAAEAATARTSVVETASVIASLRISVHLVSSLGRRNDGPEKTILQPRGARQRDSGAAEDRAADHRGLRARPRELEDVLGRPDAACREHGEAGRGDLPDQLEIRPAEGAVAIDRRAECAADAGLEAELDGARGGEAGGLRPACGSHRAVPD